ncbi:MAG TPA: hypothetical protein IAA08_07995 [Candidatus Eubacterium avistercoris]|uniref:Uncharacterized protein n=1 Tax=Candidatus Eubacterium avistercoris TaxID=2838567 RepID=A0A9D2D3Q1_9FIRM|nr:hypothetical protein [Candidatus Eubacterium avistercoris]
MYDPDPEKVRKFCEVFPQAKPAASEEVILKDPEVKLVAGAAVTSKRCALGLRVMAAGSAVFVTVSLAELLPVLPSVLSIVWILFRSTSTHFFITQLLYCDF